MTKQIILKKSEQGVSEKLDLLRELAGALLNEVRSLGQMKTIEIEKEIDFYEEIKCFEIQIIRRALELTGGNQLQAAKILRLKHTTLNAKIKRYEVYLRKPAMLLSIKK